MFKKKSGLFAASRCVQGESVVCSFHVSSRRRVDCSQLPCVIKKKSRLFAASMCNQEGESVVCNLQVCSLFKKENRLFVAFMCVEEGE